MRRKGQAHGREAMSFAWSPGAQALITAARLAQGAQTYRRCLFTNCQGAYLQRAPCAPILFLVASQLFLRRLDLLSTSATNDGDLFRHGNASAASTQVGSNKGCFRCAWILPAGNYCPGGEVLGHHRKDRLLNNSITVLGWSH